MMSGHEGFLKRTRRIVASGIDGALGAAEKATGPALLRQSVRDLEANHVKLMAGAEKAEKAATAKAEAAKDARATAKSLGDDARFAIGKNRDDLAREALARQLAHEAEADALDAAVKALKARAKEQRAAAATLEPEIESLRREVEAAIAQARLDEAGRSAGDKAGSLLDRSRALIERLSASAVGAPAEIDALRRDQEVEKRLDALKAPPAGKRARAASKKK